MANVLHRVTKEYLYSVSTPDYPEDTWIINPDLTAVFGVPKQYWKIEGDIISEMNQSEKNVIDALMLPGIKEERKSYLRTYADNLIISQGYTDTAQRHLTALHSGSARLKGNRAKYLDEWASWIEKINKEVEDKQNLVDAQTTIEDVNVVTINATSLISMDPLITIKKVIDTADSTNLNNFIDSNVTVSDPLSGMSGPFHLMQTLVNRRELFNDSTNPLYHASVTPILGNLGHLVSLSNRINTIETSNLIDHANRINNIETIHGKLGWHNQQVLKSLYEPKDLLIYYGWLNSFNSAENGWNNEKVAQAMSKYPLIIMGDGIQNPGHGDYANTSVIIPRIKTLNPSVLIFGYIAATVDQSSFETKADQWEDLAVHGVFLDEAGYDYGVTRTVFNEYVSYIHNKTNAKLRFINAWNPDHVLGVINDVSYPNSTYNPSLVASNLNADDWILLESFPINTTAYSGTGGYESKTDWLSRGQKAATLRNTYGVNFASAGIINNDNSNGAALFNFSYISALMFSLEGHGTSDAAYGASSATVKAWPIFNCVDTRLLYSLSPTVIVDAGDSDVYTRYVEGTKLMLDFSSGAQLVHISPKDNSVQILSQVFNINAKNTGTTNLYTVPSGKNCVVTSAIVKVVAADTIVTPPYIRNRCCRRRR